MKVLLLGNTGQLGWELSRTLAPLGELVALDYPAINFNRLDDLRSTVLEVHPDVIINAVAYTDVDGAERERQICLQVNATAPGLLCQTAREINAAFIHYSTDFVFDGRADRPYTETDKPKPINYYAETKLLGEQAVEQAGGAYLILRTSWMYSLRRENYLKKVLSWIRNKPVVRVVTDQTGSPTSARMLAETSAHVLAMGRGSVLEWVASRRGIYHLGGEGSASRYQLAEEIIRLDPHPEEQVLQRLEPALTRDFPTPAERPLYSVLDCSLFRATFGVGLPDWKTALQMVLDES